MSKRTAPEVSPDPSAEEPAAVWLAIDQLVEWSGNPRKNGEAIRAVAKSIRTFGFGAPIVARRANNEIIIGHTRFKAAKVLGLARVPVRFMDLDEASAHKLAIADNKLGEISEWDEEKLTEQMIDLSFSEATMLGFEMTELGKMMGEEEGDRKKSGQLGKNGFNHSSQYGVIVTVADEAQQEEVFNQLTELGFTCKVVCV